MRLSIIVVLLAHSHLHGQEINNDFLIAAILAHDSRIQDLEIDFEKRVEADGRTRTDTGTWAHKGNLCYYSWSLGHLRWEHGWDGKEERTLATGQSPWPEGFVKRDRPSFLNGSRSVFYMMGRTPFGGSLVDALENGKARLAPKSDAIKGRNCYVVEGNTISDDDRIFFKYWLDPESGFLPRRTEEYTYDGARIDSKNIYEYDLSEVSPGIWLPISFTVQGLQLKDNEWRQLAVNHWKATKVAVNTGMSDERLTVRFPPGTYVQDHPRPRSDEYTEYVIAADGSPDPAGLGTLVKLADAARKQGQAQRGQYTSIGRTKWILGSIVAGLGLCGIAFARFRSGTLNRHKRG